MEAVLFDLVAKYPICASILMVIGALRLFIKPVMSMLHAYAAYTPSQKDDVVIDKIEASKAYKGLCYVLDYLFSIKLIK